MDYHGEISIDNAIKATTEELTEDERAGLPDRLLVFLNSHREVRKRTEIPL